MRHLAAPGGSVPIVGGESGVAGLIRLAVQPAQRRQTRFGAGTRVLLIHTEGATAPSLYQHIVCFGQPPTFARFKQKTVVTQVIR